MSRLLDPGPGECLDRLVILALKIRHATAQDRPTAHWDDEVQQIVAYMEARGWQTQEDLVEQLTTVNGDLWELEDELRDFRSGLGYLPHLVVAAAFRIQALNDERARLVGAINRQAGIERQEKLGV